MNLEFVIRLDAETLSLYKTESLKNVILKSVSAYFIIIVYFFFLVSQLIKVFSILFLQHSSTEAVDWFAFLPLFAIVFLFYWLNQNGKKMSIEHFRSKGVSYLYVTYILSDEGIRLLEDNYEEFYSWDQIQLFTISKHFIDFKVSKFKNLYIPKKGVTTDEIKAITLLVKQHLPRKRMKR